MLVVSDECSGTVVGPFDGISAIFSTFRAALASERMREGARMPASSYEPSSGFAIEASSDQDTTTIAVSGELDIASADRLRAAIRSAENGTTRWIILDLEELTFMDSTGLNALLEARRGPSLNGDRLRFVHSRHGQVKKLLSITGTSETLS